MYDGPIGRPIKDGTPQELLRRKKEAARKRARYAVKTGKLQVNSCEWPPECSSVDVEGHHYDYDLPLEILWLCRQHHMELHKEMGRDWFTKGKHKIKV